MSEKAKLISKEILEWVISISLAFAIAFLLRSYAFTLVEVRGASMENTLGDKDRLFVNRLMYHPKNGDIVVLKPPHGAELYIKRVIAIGGQKIDIDYDKNQVYIDGALLEEPYLKEKNLVKDPRYDIPIPTTIPEGSVFVMGDNRNNSRDSRYSDVGIIENGKILGKAVLRVWPFGKFGNLYEKQ